MRSLLSTLLFAALVLAAVDDWPRWRGPNDNGVARGDVPTEFGDDKNIAWKANIPGRGHSSPVIWGDRIFVTTAVPTSPSAPPPPPGERKGEFKGGFPKGGFKKGPGGGGGGGGAGMGEHKFTVLCFDRKTGKLIWERVAKTAAPHEGYHARYGSHASNSPITDGKYLYASFGSRGMFVYDFDGKLIWEKQFRPMRMRLQFGEGSPTTLHGDRLFLNFDSEEDSYVLALDKRTGKEVWRVAQDELSSWSPPFVVEHKGAKQVVVPASNKVRSYDYDTGKLLWETVGLGSNVIQSPVTQRDIVYVMSGHRDPNLMAIRLGGAGNLAGTSSILWQQNRGTSYSPSPVLDDNKFYMLTDTGMLSCLNATTGEPYYHQQRLPKPYSFKASPVAVNGKLYLSAENGDVVVAKMGEKFEILATNTFTDEFFVASPAVTDGSMYLRGKNTLYCVRQP